MVKRIIGIILVFLCTTVAWMILGGIMKLRTQDQTASLHGDVADLWGSPQRQAAPSLIFHWDTWEDRDYTEEVDGKTKKVKKRVLVHHTENLIPGSSEIEVGLTLDQRLKGLMWYSLYDVNFAGAWSYKHEIERDGELEVVFAFPDAQGLFDDFRFTIDAYDHARESSPQDGRVSARTQVATGQTVAIGIGYTSRGMDQWTYEPGSGVGRLEQFRLAMTTDFPDIDFPPYTMSPTTKTETGDGWNLEWTFKRVITGKSIGMVMPELIQPGEMAASLAFSAPISLLFFFLLLFVLATLRDIDIHPINYFFLAGAFFAFHLLFGYSVDHLQLIPAFVLSSIVSIILVVSYIRMVVSARFAFFETAAAQLIYLVGFSLAYFWDGYTGLTLTVLSILTLFVLMQLTGRLKWSEVLAGKPKATAG